MRLPPNDQRFLRSAGSRHTVPRAAPATLGDLSSPSGCIGAVRHGCGGLGSITRLLARLLARLRARPPWSAVPRQRTSAPYPAAAGPPRGSAGRPADLTVGAVDAPRPAASVEVLEERDDGAAGGGERHPGLARGEGLRQRGQDAHRVGRGRGQQQHAVVEPHETACTHGGSHLSGLRARPRRALAARGRRRAAPLRRASTALTARSTGAGRTPCWPASPTRPSRTSRRAYAARSGRRARSGTSAAARDASSVSVGSSGSSAARRSHRRAQPPGPGVPGGVRHEPPAVPTHRRCRRGRPLARRGRGRGRRRRSSRRDARPPAPGRARHPGAPPSRRVGPLSRAARVVAGRRRRRGHPGCGAIPGRAG